MRFANRVSHARTGWNVTATITAATIVRNELPRPNVAPSPTTSTRYTIVANTASAA